MRILEDLPVELIFGVLHELGVPELLQCRLVGGLASY